MLLRPKTPFAGPVLISCKAWSNPVGVDHVREWADIVQRTGAASGVIVAQTGFTSVAIDAAKNPDRRLTLWKPRALTRDDFAPDEDAGTGYIARVQTRMVISEPRFVEGSFRLDVVRADGHQSGAELEFEFSAASRNQWYLRDEIDNVTENLWDLFVARGEACKDSGSIDIVPDESRFLVLGGTRFHLRRASFDMLVLKHERMIDIDVLKRAIGYENVVTKQVTIVPLPRVFHAPLLDGRMPVEGV